MSSPANDIYLGDKASLQGYRCRSFVRDSAPLVAPKFSTGVQGQTDLDLLKVDSVDELSGGMFQRTHDDPTKVSRATGWYNSFDKLFYPTVPTTTSTAGGVGLFVCKVESEQYSFAIFYARSGGLSFNALNKYVGNSITSVTMPAALNNLAAVTEVCGLCLHKGYLFAAASPGDGFYANTAAHRYDIAGNTWVNIGGFVRHFFTLRGALYAIGTGSQLYAVTTETSATATYTQVGTVGGSDTLPTDIKEFNGAAWLFKSDGIYRFDGVAIVKVLSLKIDLSTVWNGALWLVVGNWLYRFDGANLQKVQYFTTAPTDISASSLYLFVLAWSTSASIDSPKALSGSGFFRLYAYDGNGFSLVVEKDITSETGTSSCLIYSSSYITYTQQQNNSVSWDNVNHYLISLANVFSASAITSNSLLDVTSSEDDAGFPNIYKTLEAIEINHSGMINGDVITVKYQLYNGKTWGSWQTLGTITYSSATNYLEVTDASNKLYKRVKINVYVSTMTAGSTLAFQGFSWRYTLQPRARWRWQIGLPLAGNSTLTDRTGAFISSDSNLLVSGLNQSIKQKTPLYLLAPDYGLLDTTINAAATTIIIGGQIPLYTDPYNEYPLVALKNDAGTWEIWQVTAVSYSSITDKTTLTINARGYLGITAGAATAGAEFRLCYKVYITRLLRDNVTLDSGTYNEQTTGESQIQRDVLLEVTEV